MKGVKTCTKCGETKPASEFYAGRSDCKACKIAYRHAHYAPRKAATAAKRQAVYRDGLKRCRKCGQYKTTDEYSPHHEHWDRLSHVCKTCVNALTQARYRDNPEAQRQRNRQRYKNNPARKLEQNAAWRKAHPDKSRAIWHRHRGRKLSAEGEFTAAQWQALVAHYCPDGRCLCCLRARKLEADHVIPLLQGGSNYISNIQPLCRSCNSQKGDERTHDYRPDRGAFALSLTT